MALGGLDEDIAGSSSTSLNSYTNYPSSSISDADGDGHAYDETAGQDPFEEDADFQSQYSGRPSSASIDSDEEGPDDSIAAQEEEEEEEEEEEDREGEDITSPHTLLHSNGSLHGLNAFAPPFYNRPPTPLPPSPSLTSLLRPSFSTTTSRPTTPDSSDAETPNDTEAAVAKSARIATTVPRASPKVPTYEYYGFVLYVASSVAFLMYLLWSYLPSPFLHQLGIYYYPNRWWSLAIPSYLVMTIVYIYVALSAYNVGYLTLPMSSVENIVDDAANIAVINAKGRRREGGSAKMNRGASTAVVMGARAVGPQWEAIWSEGTDAVMDIPVGGVCEVLYAEEREEQESPQSPESYHYRISSLEENG